MKKINKPLVVGVLVVFALMGAGCDRLGKNKAPDTKPVKLVKLDQNLAVLSPVASFSLPENGSRLKNAVNKRDILDLQIAHVNDTLVTASRSGVVTAFSGATAVWSVNVDDAITGGVATDGGLVVVSTRSGKVIAMNGGTGEIIWQKSLKTSVLAPALISEERVMVSANDGVVYALDGKTGEQVWRFATQDSEISVRGTATPIRIDGQTALFGTSDGRIHAINPTTGTPLWTRRVGQAVGGSQVQRMNDVDGTPLVVGDYLYVVSYSGQLAGFDMNTGRTMFVSPLASIKSLTLLGDAVIGASVTGDMVAFHRLTGEKLWENNDLKYRQLTNPVTIGNHVAVGDLDGVIHVFDGQGRIVSRNETKGRLTSLHVHQNQLYTQTATGTVSIWQF